MSEKLSRKKWGFKSGISLLIAFGLTMLFMVVPMASAHFFDTVGQSARPLGMGEVFLLSSGDANGMWYNPAGLSSGVQREIGYTAPDDPGKDMLEIKLIDSESGKIDYQIVKIEIVD